MQYDNDMKSTNKDLFLAARTVLLDIADIVETRKEGITTYSNDRGGICHMRTVHDGIDVGFLKGAKMEDAFNLLTGKGKAMRVLHLKEMNKNILLHYVTHAITLNQ